MAQAMLDMRYRAAMGQITDFFVNGNAMPSPTPTNLVRSDFHSTSAGYSWQSIYDADRRKPDQRRKPDRRCKGNIMPADPAPTPVSSSPVLSDVNSTSAGLKKPRRRGRRPKSAVSGKGSGSGGTKPAGQETKNRSSSRSDRKDREKLEEAQTPITSFFPVRRSDRRGMSSAEVKKKRETVIIEKIKAGCEDGLQVMEIEGKGRGVVATREFNKDDFVVEYAGELVNITTAKQREHLYEKDEQVGCYMYYFTHKNKHYCIDATEESGRLGRLVNHSRKGNCHTKVVTIGDNPYLVLLASQQIEKGQELTYDYGDRSQTAIESHPWLKL